MSKPVVAIVGRPNVGKSAFFNKIVSKRISIVKDEAGVTRDRIYEDAEWCGVNFTLIDTGGIELKSEDVMFKNILIQAQVAMEEADVIVFMVDGRSGLVASDYEVAKILRHSKKPIILLVNKLDNYEIEKTYDFYELGLGEPHGISVEQAKGLGDALDEIVKNFPPAFEDEIDDRIKIALVGRPNVGKSSLINKLLGFDRVIVSDIAGTTRDSIDTPFEFDGKKYTLIDTAGMRRKREIELDTVESYSVIRSMRAIDRADIVLVVMSTVEDMAEQDVRIAGMVHESGKPSVVVMNKWDIIEKDTHTIERFKTKLKNDLAFMDYKKEIFVSALTGLRVEKIMKVVDEVHGNASKRITTGVLNDIIMDAVAVNNPPSYKGKRLKIYYTSQVATNPPTFVFKVNDDNLIHFSYQRYLENQIRKAVDFSGTPIRLIFRGSEEEKNK
ncbi:MAG: ribosome biogenesis GTPase Der [Firmicutes bacterium]|nr:ribosome biogenesis GTPase Der [Bacillota bacterium]